MSKKRETCKFCNISFLNLSTSLRANHTRWCINNPKRSSYAMSNSVKQLNTAEAIAKRSKKISEAHAAGKYVDSFTKGIRTKRNNGTLFHTDKTKQILREKALASSHRRLKRGMIEYNGVMLDSSWELALAKRLDELSIAWVRPSPIKWTDNEGIIHNYFPDFYLPEYDLYLDPKNPQAVKVQRKKIEILLTQYKNIIILDTLEKCRNYMRV